MSKQEAYQRLLDAALSLFAEYGLHATPTSKISKRAGLSTGLLFHHFSGKDALIIALYIREKLSWYDSILTNEVARLDFKEKLAAVISGSLRWMQQNPEAVRFIMQIHPTAYRQEAEANEQLQPARTLVEETFSDAQALGQIIGLPPLLIEEMIFYQLVATVEYARHHPEYQLDAKAENTLFELIWKQLSI